MNVTVVLPSLNPDEKLMQVVQGLLEHGFEDIVIVNDGSDEAHMEPFREAVRYPQVTLLTHEENKGKGRALKTAFTYCVQNRPHIAGVVTVDGDNQHLPKDIAACAKALTDKQNHVILGVRDFSGREVPFKSKFGNTLTRMIFRIFCGLKLSDTQTGLRAIPIEYLKLMTEVSGERFEYETQMLLALKKNGIPYEEIKITTVYIEDNATTHFHPVRDSIQIYRVIFKFFVSSVLSFLIDYGIFTLLVCLLADSTDRSVRLLIATAAARVISSICNYCLNRRAVFRSKASVNSSLVKYYILCIFQAGLSYGLVLLFTGLLGLKGFTESLVKVIVDVILFFISFQIQRKWVFGEKGIKGKEQ